MSCVANAHLNWTVGNTTGKPLRHDSIQLGEHEWAGESGALLANVDLPIRKGDSIATAFIVIGDWCVDRRVCAVGIDGHQYSDQDSRRHRSWP